MLIDDIVLAVIDIGGVLFIHAISEAKAYQVSHHTSDQSREA